MNSYNDLVSKILKFSVLKKAVEDMVTSHTVLNLVSLKWEDTILNSEVYKKHLETTPNYSTVKTAEKFIVKVMTDMNCHYHVVVAGCWKFHILKKKNEQFDSIVCNSCQPLLLIGESLAENNKEVFIDNSRFFFQACDALICSTCEDVRKASYHKNIWCVKNTKVFNGQHIRCLLRREVLNAFGSSRMYGILRLKIYSRTIFDKIKYKMGGLCSEMILFNESSLDPPVNIEHLFTPIESHEKPPEITYPEDKEISEES